MKAPHFTTGARIGTVDASETGVVRVRKVIAKSWIDAAALVIIGIIFVVPFVFILLTAAKTQQEAAQLAFTWPSPFQLWSNIRDVVAFGNYRMVLALWNSTVLTVGSVTLIVVLSAMVAYVMQRRRDRVASVASTVMLAGLIIPPAIVPTIFLLQSLGLYKTISGLIMVNVATSLPFGILLLRAFMGTIPRELDEAAIIDGASPSRVFVSIVLPLLKPAIVTVIVVQAVGIYNDFAGPLYFLPGAENVTVQLTLYTYISQFSSQWNLLFANVLVVTIPPLIMFIFFRRQIVAGMTAGGVKG
ncbi:MAG TPA: carbohydrate ABC transporter permease [Thermomicrobiales bacterium]|nr:carbohydrate ABC transporter permease [Thermomicrobiales bacterium]